MISWLFICWITLPLQSQICQPGKPFNDTVDVHELYTVKFKPPTTAEIEKLKNEPSTCNKALKFAKVVQTSVHPESSGRWKYVNNGNKIWRIRLLSPGAHSLNITFGRYFLTEGVDVFIYDPKKKFVIGALTDKNNNPDSILAVSPIPGDELIIEMQVEGHIHNYGKLAITSLGHDYLNVFEYLRKDGQFGKSGYCNTDIQCISNPTIQTLKRAVCRIIYKNSELCTGTLVNNTAKDAAPFLLTANHCLPDQNTASTAVFLFGYESPLCNGPDGNSTWTISGSQLLATATSVDFSLVRLSKEIPRYYFPYFAGWDHSDKFITNTFTIHHPWGDVKKISFDDDPPVSDRYSSSYQPESHWKVVEWDSGTTEPGSSGCPLFNRNYSIIGDLTGGDATCLNPVNDYFNKFSMSWDFFNEPEKQLKHWLDPIHLNLESLEGYDPNSELIQTCEPLANFTSNDPKNVKPVKTGWGFWSGHSSRGFLSFAERFNNDTILQIRGLFLQFAKIPDNSFGSVSIKLWSGDELPAILLAEKKYYYDQLTPDADIYLSFDTIASVVGNFYAGIEINYNNPNDTLALYQVKSSIKSPGATFYVKKDNTYWDSYKSLTHDLENSALAVKPLACGNISKSQPLQDNGTKPVFLPNPVYRDLILDLKTSEIKSVDLSIYDLSGRLVHKTTGMIYTRTMTVNLEKLHTGIYVCEIIVNGNRYSHKMVVAKD